MGYSFRLSFWVCMGYSFRLSFWVFVKLTTYSTTGISYYSRTINKFIYLYHSLSMLQPIYATAYLCVALLHVFRQRVRAVQSNCNCVCSGLQSPVLEVGAETVTADYDFLT